MSDWRKEEKMFRGTPMRKSFEDSLKALEADIQHANTLATEFRNDGAYFRMRMSYGPAAPLFLFLVQWADCSLAGALGLLRILIFKVYIDGATTMSTYERKASIKQFYGIIFPSLMQLQMGITDMEDTRQKTVCKERYRRNDIGKRKLSKADSEREKECGICMEMCSKIVLPNCCHTMCMRCYSDWHSRSQSCPFCRDSLKGVSSADLWVYPDGQDIVDMETMTRTNVRQLYLYIDKLPLVSPDTSFEVYSSRVKCS